MNISKKQPVPSKRTVSAPQLLECPATAKKLGYARVSTDDQVLDVQMTALRNAGCDVFFSETISAVNAKRPQFNLMLKHVEPGDTVVFYSFSRISRDLKFLLGFIDEMHAMGVTLKSTSEPHIDPYTSHGRMMVSMIGTMDEHERNRVKDRARDAMAEKRRQGMYLGRPIKVTPRIAKDMKRLRKTLSVAAIAKRFSVSAAAVYSHTR